MICDQIALSNNSINENMYNAKKSKNKVQLKHIIKPILKFLKKNRNTYRKSPQPDYFVDEDQEIEDNLANELLEKEIFGEIDVCDEDAALPVYEDGVMNIIPVCRGQRYIPVHFAKTEAGTFFWTTMVHPDKDVDDSGDLNAITNNQVPEIQACRWAQA